MRTEKYLSCDADGNLKLTPATYEDFYDEILESIYEIEDRTVRLRKLLYFADSCRSCRSREMGYNLDGWAYCAYITVFRSISWKSTGEEHDLLEHAVGGLTGLSSSEDEYMWEKTSQIVGDYYIWKRDQEKEK